jgi:hypothetical protein
MISELVWKRTGKITLRCEPYLIIRYPTRYTALHGEIGKRDVLGHYPDAEGAKNACIEHQQKNDN